MLSRLFRRLFLEELEKAFNSHQLRFFSTVKSLSNPLAFAGYLAPLKSREWVVYAKPPFAGPQQVLDYVGRYTHRVAISNNRLLAIDNGSITFRWKDYRHHNQRKTMTLPADEFLRRFLLHVLPDGFQRIRYYRFLGNRNREEKLARCRQLLGMAAAQPETPCSLEDYRDRYERLTGCSLRECPSCSHGRMVLVETLAPTLGRLTPHEIPFISEQKSGTHKRIALRQKCRLTGFHANLAAMRNHFLMLLECRWPPIQSVKSHNGPTY